VGRDVEIAWVPRLRQIGIGPVAVLCLALACGGRRVIPPGPDGAADTGVDRPGDVAAERATQPPPPDAAVDAPGETSDANRDQHGGGTMDGRDDGVVTPPCPVDCHQLPHVKAGAVVDCRDGICMVPSDACEPGFAHCSIDPNDGCETDISQDATCGSCAQSCAPPFSFCAAQSGGYACVPVCRAPYPDNCSNSCVDTRSDVANCGSCGYRCNLPNAESDCVNGECVVAVCVDAADCTSAPGCETPLGTTSSCAGCGDQSCPLANTLVACASADSCVRAVCAAGFANCDGGSPDCEARFDAGAACLPGYLGTAAVAMQPLNGGAAAIGTDGSFFVAGAYMGTVDFDSSANQDVHSTAASDDFDGFITKINPDGSYGWTRTFSGPGEMMVRGLVAAADGAIVAVGEYGGSVDLDPGTGVDLHETVMYGRDAVAVKLTSDGAFVWGKTFAGMDAFSQSGAVAAAVDDADAVYVAGNYEGTVTFDSGATGGVQTAEHPTAMLVKLTATGTFSWFRSIENTGCADGFSGVAVATDGAVWVVGDAESLPSCGLGSPHGEPTIEKALVVSYRASGDLRGQWMLGDGRTNPTRGTAVAASSGGAVYVGGWAGDVVDLDPGPAEVMRWTGRWPGGFILKLGSDASLEWVQTLPQVPIYSLAATSDGGVLAGANYVGSLVTKLNADGTPAWSFAPGSSVHASVQTVAARGGSFAVAGISYGSGDFDPGATMDLVLGDIIYLSRFTF